MSKARILLLLFSLVLSIGLLFSLASCEEEEEQGNTVTVCDHNWTAATCTAPKTCTECGKQQGPKANHTWAGGDCVTPATCSVCQQKGDEPAGHTWSDATCTAPKTCTTCKITEGEPTGHVGGIATCLEKAVCTVCNNAYGEIDPTNHAGDDFTYLTNKDGTHTKTHTGCGNVADAAEKCTGGTATCSEKAICDNCRKAYGEYNSENHSGMANAFKSAGNGTHNRVYSCCDEPVETNIACSGGTATCTDKAICITCNGAYGDKNPLVHSGEATVIVANGNGTHDKKYDCCGVVKETVNCSGGEATCTEKAVCEKCNTAYGETNGANHATEAVTYTSNGDNTHTAKHTCCGAEEAGENCVGGTATCTEKAVCEKCAEAYGDYKPHEGGTATCTDKAVCSVCNNEYGEKDAANHVSDDVTYTSNGDNTHTVKHSCCNAEDAPVACSGGEATCTEKAVCEKCNTAYGETNGANHASEDVTYTSNGNNTHTAKYSCCGAVKETVNCSGGEATCTEKAVCIACNTEYGEKDAANHATDAVTYTSNGDNTHTAKHDCCGAEEAAENCAGGEASCTAKAICEKCEEAYGDYKPHEGGTATCTDKAVCSVCNNEYGEKDAANHASDAVTYTSNGDNTHTVKHSCCNAEDAPVACSGGEATCTAKAVCEKCNTEYGVTDGENHSSEEVKYISNSNNTHTVTHSCCNTAVKDEDCSGGEATCIANAICEKCITEYGNKNEANHANDVVTYTSNGDNTHTAKHSCCGAEEAPENCSGGEATCTAKAVCDKCDKEYGTLNSTNHASAEFAYTSNGNNTHTVKYACCGVPIETKSCSGGEASCDEKAVCEYCEAEYGGYTDHIGGTATCQVKATCDVCGNEYGEVGGHNFTEEVAISEFLAEEATCESAAKYYKSCSVCHTAGTETFTDGDPADHDWDIWISNGDDTHTRYCNNFNTHVETKACSGGTATCVDPAVCKDCNNDYGTALDHEWKNVWIVTTEPTCTARGVETDSCNRSGCTATRTRSEGIDSLDPLDHDYDDVVTDPTCTEQGYTTHTCNRTYCGDSYADTFVAASHLWDIPAQTCVQGQTCQRGCGATTPALGHTYGDEPTSTVPADCTNPAKYTYTCSVCEEGTEDHSYTEDYGSANGHTFGTPELGDAPVPGTTCEYTQTVTCAVPGCGHTEARENTFKHNYEATIVTYPTCQDTGTKKFICTECGDDKEGATEDIVADTLNGHKWVEGNVSGEFYCEHGCGKTKTVVVVADGDKVNPQDNKDKELQLPGGANITLGDAADKIAETAGDKDVEIKVEAFEGEDRNTIVNDAEKLAQVGDSPIYNFTISDGTQNITSFGENKFVTVSLPYTPADPDNVKDTIAVWYIDKDGNLTSIEATFNNGYVTFQTDHFSYYTVTELTPKERCELYGHSFVETVTAATCTTKGYTTKYCVRCGIFEKANFVDALKHQYTLVEASSYLATCEAAGLEVYECQREGCGNTYKKTLPKRKHNWAEDKENSLEATCYASGYTLYECAYDNCDATRSLTIPETDHVVVDETVDPTCVAQGYTVHKCTNAGCTYNYNDSYTEATGHYYTDDSYTFAWNENADGEGYASVTFVAKCMAEGCGYEESIEDLPITVKSLHADCNNYARDEYTARVEFNGNVYTDKKAIVTGSEYKHYFNGSWNYDETSHWQQCGKCSKHDEKHKDNHKIKDQYVTIEPTCSTPGEKVYVCQCNFARYEEIPATGEHTYSDVKFDEVSHWTECTVCGEKANEAEHSFVYNATTEATCGTAGERITSCEGCGLLVNEIIPATGEHSYVSVVTKEATCSADGEMTHTCEGCGLVSKEVIPATGEHTYSDVKFDDDAHWTECTACGTKADEAKHSFIYNVTKEATCAEDGEITITCEGCGITKTEFVPATGKHNLVSVVTKEATCAENGEITNTCDVCGLTETEVIPATGKHNFVSVVTKAATCVEAGEITNTCEVCGLTETKVIPATGEHTYEDGVCTGCGRNETDCTHEPTVEGVLDLSEYGLCMTELTVIRCNCGETVTLKDINEIDKTCQWIGDINDYGENEDGSMWLYAVSRCAICGLVAEINATAEMGENCKINVTYSIKLSHNDLVIIDNLGCFIEQESHSYGETVKVDLGEYSSCGGYYTSNVCYECGKQYDAYNLYLNCDFVVETSEYTDDAGLVHVVNTHICRNCDFVYVTDYALASDNPCETITLVDIKLYLGDEVIYSEEYTSRSGSHNYESEYELIGDSCDDGYRVIRTCESCGYVDEYTSEGHVNNYHSVDFDEYGACYGHASVYTCEICGETGIDYSYCCALDNGIVSFNTYTDENGIEHEITRVTCLNCGLTYITDIWESKSGCEVWRYTEITVTIASADGTAVTIVSGTREELYEESHNWEFEFDLKGDSCQDGYYVTGTCSVCGVSDTAYNSGHFSVEVNVDLAEEGACGGILTYYACGICGEVETIGSLEPDCNIDLDTAPPTTEVVDENGIVHYIQSVTCPDCGLKVEVEGWEIAEGCYAEENVIIRIYVGENLVFDYYVYYENERHNTEPEYVLYGDSCDDGYEIRYVCTECGYIDYSYEGYGHNYEYHVFDFAEAGACGGTFEYDECIICGDFVANYLNISCMDKCETTVRTEIDENGFEHYIEELVCPDCGLVVISDNWADANGCEATRYTRIQFTLNGEEILSKEMHSTSTNHEFDYRYESLGESCENGVLVEYACVLCGYVDHYYTEYNHHYIKGHIELSDYGMCGGYIDYVMCVACDYKEMPHRNFYCNLMETGITEDGYTEYACDGCGAIVRVLETTVEGEYCNYETISHTIVIAPSGEVVFDYLYSDKYQNHVYDYNYTMLGESCEDGIYVERICTKCATVDYTYTEYGHYYEMESISLSAYGMCGGYVNYNVCVCCDYREIADYNLYCNFMATDAITDGYTESVCEYCGSVMREQRTESVDENCNYEFTSHTVVIAPTGETVIDYLYTDRYESHNFEYKYTMLGESCKDGILVEHICTVCATVNYTYTEYDHYFVAERTELSDYGMCGGYVECVVCVGCDYIEKQHYNIYCNFIETGVAEDGYIEYVCDKCGAIGRACETRVELENCGYERTVHTVVIAPTGETVIDDVITDSYIAHNYTYSYTLSGESCYDGVDIVYTCEGCGDTYTDWYDWHKEYEVFNVGSIENDFCEHHYFYVTKCLCGEYENVNTDRYDGEYACESCSFRVVSTSEVVNENCYLAEVHSITLYSGETELYRYERRYDSYLEHDLSLSAELVADGCIVITAACENCDFVTTYTRPAGETVTLVYDPNTGLFYYDLPVSVDENGYYTIYSMTDGDTYVELYVVDENGNYNQINSDDDGSYNNNFRLNAYLEVGVNYVYRIRFYGSSHSGDITYFFEKTSEGEKDDSGCDHDFRGEYYVLYPDADSCVDGVFAMHICHKCGAFRDVYLRNDHVGEWEYYYFSDYGACDGYVELYNCLCGENKRSNYYYGCNDNFISETVTDENGVEHYIETYDCSACGKHLVFEVYNAKEGCRTSECIKIELSINGETKLSVIAYTGSYWDDHSYEQEFVFDDATGEPNCENGVSIVYTCVDCGNSYTDRYSGHREFEIFNINSIENDFCDHHYYYVNACACGEYKNVYYDGEYACDLCSFKVVTANETVNENCYYENVYTVVLYSGEAELYRYERRDGNYEHSFLLSSELLADGRAVITAACENCDFVTSYTEPVEPEGITVTLVYNEELGYYYYDIPVSVEEDGRYYIYFTSDLTMEIAVELLRVYEDGSYGYIDSSYYGLERYLEIGDYVYRVKFGDVSLAGDITYFFTKTGETENNSCDHYYGNRYYVLYPGVTSCEDGVFSMNICHNCGEIVDIYTENHHIGEWKNYNFSDYGACSGWVEFYTCLCGNSRNANCYQGCYDNYNSENKTDENGVEHYIEIFDCSVCRKHLVLDHYTIVDGCKSTSYIKVELSINGEVKLSKEVASDVYYNHNYEYEYDFGDAEGEVNCENGVTINLVCTDCGYTDSSYYTHHYTFTKETIDFTEYGACSGRIALSGCACGYYTSFSNYGYCSTDSTTETLTDADGNLHTVHTDVCRTCGLTVVRDSYSAREGCEIVTYQVYNITVGETVVLDNFVAKTRTTAHNYEYLYVFDKNDGVLNCEDGVTVTRVCLDCGETYEYGRYTSHTTFAKYYYLADFGGCGGYIKTSECACGQNVGSISTNYNCSMSSEYSNYTDENGIEHSVRTYTCQNCGLVRIQDSYSEKVGCTVNEYRTETYIMGDAEIISEYKYRYSSYDSHNYEITFNFTGDSEECEAGVEYIYTCRDCGHYYTETRSNHQTVLKAEYNLADYGACGGYYRLYECACGKEGSEGRNFSCSYTSSSDSYVDEDGVLHNVVARYCENCGFRYQKDSYTVRDSATCRSITYNRVSLNVGSSFVDEVNYTHSEVSHNYVVSGRLDEGAESCEDGAYIVYTCADCGYNYENRISWHERYEVERYDLQAAENGGALHIGYVVVEQCPCERYKDITYTDSLCEFYRTWIDCFIEEYASFNYQNTYTADNYYGVSNHSSYMLTCAVTDIDHDHNPDTDTVKCGYIIRYSTYYLPIEGECKAIEYETWQLGYDLETDTWANEITVETGNTIAYHRYESSSLEENYENGMIKVRGARYDCPDCGSYWYDKYEYREDGTLSLYDRYYVNTLDDGRRKEFREYREYDESGINVYTKYTYVYADGSVSYDEYLYEYDEDGNRIYEKNKHVNADGSYESREYAYSYHKGYQYTTLNLYERSGGYWERRDYTYDFAAGCVRTYVYTTSSGGFEKYTEPYHISTYVEYDVYPTCTQDGLWHECCSVCEQILEENITVSPYGHSWNYGSADYYYCGRCGLENTNGADGDIIFEDLTEQYGDGEYYVAGYWARNNVQFIYNVSLMLYTPLEDGNDQIILMDFEVIELSDGVRALAISKSAVIAAAAELGYEEGTYDVRLSFVPFGADERHDYAITFTDNTIAEPDDGSDTGVNDGYVDPGDWDDGSDAGDWT